MKKYYIFMFIFLFSGCIQKKNIVSPEISGTIIDSKTLVPLKNVEVEHYLTDNKGKFLIEGKSELIIGIPIGGVYSLPVKKISIFKQGYKKCFYVCDSLSSSEGCLNIVIKLEREQKNNFFNNNKYKLIQECQKNE